MAVQVERPRAANKVTATHHSRDRAKVKVEVTRNYGYIRVRAIASGRSGIYIDLTPYEAREFADAIKDMVTNDNIN